MSDDKSDQKNVGGAEDLFDLMGSEGEKFKKEKPTQNKPQQKQETGKRSTLKIYPAGTLVVHSGDRRELPKEMTEKEVFELYGEDHPDVSLDRYELIEDKEKGRLWFRAKGFKKGGRSDRGAPQAIEVFTAPPKGLPTPPAVYRLLGSDGVYEIRRTPLGTFIAPIACGLEISAGFYPKVPKAPTSLLAEAIELFAGTPEVEAVAEIFHERRSGSFHLFRPEQREATAGGVTYDPLPETEDVFCYLNLHSHNRMPAFFSATDDEYETKSGLYGVIGRLGDEGKPEAMFCMSCGGNFVYMSAESLFDDASLVNSLVDQQRAVHAGGFV